jgi:hypothetical protein
MREIDLNVIIGPAEFEVTFQVVDIKSTFNLILGRPWLHTHKVIPSSLHQCLKFLFDGEIIIIMAEPETIMPQDTSSCSTSQQVSLIDINTSYPNPNKILENLQKQWNFTPG